MREFFGEFSPRLAGRGSQTQYATTKSCTETLKTKKSPLEKSSGRNWAGLLLSVQNRLALGEIIQGRNLIGAVFGIKSLKPGLLVGRNWQ